MNWISLNSMIRKWFRRKPLNVLEGGTGANTFEKACENLGAVKKTGDIITGNLEFYGENEAGESFIHPIVNAKAGENGIDVIVGGSNNKSSFVVGCGDWADKAAEMETNLKDGNLSLTANDSIRLFQKRTRTVKNENNEDQTEDYLAERWRFNTSGYLTHRNAYDQQNYHPFSCVCPLEDVPITLREEDKEEDPNDIKINAGLGDRTIGSVRVNSSFGKTGYLSNNTTLFGIQGNSRGTIYFNNKTGKYEYPSQNNSALLLGANDSGDKIVAFRPGYDSPTNDNAGNKAALAWKDALINETGYGTSAASEADVKTAWAKWVGTPPWTIVNNVHKGTTYADASASTLETTIIGKYEIPETAKEIFVYAREQVASGTNKYRYNSVLILPKAVFNPINEDGRVFVLGGGWNNLFTGDAAKFRLSKQADGKYTLKVLGMSVNNTWIGSRWFIYSR